MSNGLSRRVGRGIAGLLAALHCAGCFEFDAPVEERLELLFHADASVEVSAMMLVRTPWQDFEGHADVQDRLDVLRDAVQHEEDLWSRAMKTIEPRRERVVREYEKGRLVMARRQALVEDPRAVEALFALTPVSALVDWEGPSAEEEPREESLPGRLPSGSPHLKGGTLLTFELVPSTAGLATERQRRQAEEALAAFSEALASHLKALAELYRFLEKAPDLEEWAMAGLVGEEAEPPEGQDHLVEQAEQLIEAAGDSTEGLATILEVAEGEGYTLDEISRLVHDPFPAAVVVEVTGAVEEVAGFLAGEKGQYMTRRHGLWDALESLEGRWVSPIPAVAWVGAIRGSEDVDKVDKEALVESLLARPLTVHEVPGADQIRAALIEQMTPPALYRLRWRLPA